MRTDIIEVDYFDQIFGGRQSDFKIDEIDNDLELYVYSKGGIYERVGAYQDGKKDNSNFLLGWIDEDEDDPFFESLTNTVNFESNQKAKKKSSGERKIRYWDNLKYQKSRRLIKSFEGQWRTMVSIIFERKAYQDFKGIAKAVKALKKVVYDYSGEKAAISVLEAGEKHDPIKKQSAVTPHYHVLMEVEYSKKLKKAFDYLVGKYCWGDVKIQKIEKGWKSQQKVRSYVYKRRKAYDENVKGDHLPGGWDQAPLKCYYEHRVKDRIKYVETYIEKDLVGLLSYFDCYKFSDRFKKLKVKGWGKVEGIRSLFVDNVDWSIYKKIEKTMLGFNLLITIERRGGSWKDFNNTFSKVMGEEKFIGIDKINEVGKSDIDFWFWESLRSLKEDEIPQFYDYDRKPFYGDKVWFNVLKPLLRPNGSPPMTYDSFVKVIHPSLY